MIATDIPFPTFPDLDGRPLDAGYVYFGARDENPETDPVTVYWDAAGTQPASQPIRTQNGYMVRNGTPAIVYVASDYSMTVRNSRRQFVFYAPSSVRHAGSVTDEFTCTAGQTEFTLSRTPDSASELSVVLDGLVLTPSDYSLSGTTLTLATPALEDQELTVRHVITLPLGGVDASQVAYTPAGAGAVVTNVQAKLRETVSIGDHGTSADWAAALIAAAAATAGAIHIPAGVSAINPAAGQVAGVLATLNRLRVDGTLTITLPSGTRALTSQVVVNTPDAQRISVVGTAPLSTTATSQVSSSGAAKAYSVIIGVASSAGVEVGDYALIYQDVTGTGDYEVHAGCWEITAVDSGGANRLTLLNTHNGAAWPTNTLTGGTVKILKTVLQFTGCDGFRFEGGQPLGRLDQVAIVGDYDLAAATGTTGAHGIIMSAPVITGGGDSNARHNMAGGAAVGPNVGVSAFGEQGIAVAGRCVLVANFVASCSNRKRGWYSEGGNIRAKFTIGSGNGEDGYISDVAGALQVNSSFACGNGLNGYWSTNNSMLVCASAHAVGNLSNGFEARGLTRIGADLAVSRNNTSAGFLASDGGMIDADSSEADGNGAHGFDASSGGVIDCDNCTSTDNTGYGFRAQYGSVIRAAGATVSGNTTASYLSNNGSVLFESGGGVSVLDTPTYSVGQRFYNSTKANYYAIAITSIGDAAWTSGSTSRFVWKTDGTLHPSTDNTQPLGRSTERWQHVYGTNFRPGAGTATWTSGTGTPEGAVTATVGSMFTRTDGGAGTTLYIKESGSGNTGWAAK